LPDEVTKLRRERLSRGFRTEKMLADALGLAAGTIHFWERNICRPYPRNAVRLEAMFQMPISDLLSLDSAKEADTEVSASVIRQDQSNLKEGRCV
jgi:transcriptional regulator with XRE-family HTH domain